MPTNVDAAVIWNYDEKPVKMKECGLSANLQYFFKGQQYWQYSRWGMVRPEWPKPIDTIFDVTASRHPPPTHIDAALKWTNNKTYLFTGDHYYRLSGWRVMKVS